jgi:hypothetical protein
MSRGDLRAAQREKWALYYKPIYQNEPKAGQVWGEIPLRRSSLHFLLLAYPGRSIRLAVRGRRTGLLC